VCDKPPWSLELLDRGRQQQSQALLQQTLTLPVRFCKLQLTRRAFKIDDVWRVKLNINESTQNLLGQKTASGKESVFTVSKWKGTTLSSSVGTESSHKGG